MLMYMLIALAALIAAFWYWQNDTFHVEKMVVPVKNLPKSFENIRIALISDLHGKAFGMGNKRLIEEITLKRPEAVFFAGDLLDERKGNVKDAVALMTALAKKCPVFVCTGNHDLKAQSYAYAENEMKAAGVRVLRSSMAVWRRGSDALAVIGIEDGRQDMAWLEQIQRPACTLALCHRPNCFAEGGVSSPGVLGAQLVFSGHNHGGQWRLPGRGGLYMPDDGFAARYDAGLYEEGGGKMLVSRGLGNSIFPLRLNNRPQILLAELVKEE